ncbi:MAG: hypothetical protein ABSB71_10840 [Candidatus Bathyarchaeia archaeon]|jgi:hypothetical protein
MPKKGKPWKVYLAIILIVVIAVAAAAVIYTTQHPKSKTINVVIGVHVGDWFTYNITGESALYSSDANPESEYAGFNSINGTTCTITITQINGTVVTFTQNWGWSNGTHTQDSQWLNISSGEQSNQNGFWMLYPADLKINDYTRPGGYDYVQVNNTETRTFSSSSRQMNYFGIQGNFTDTRDPTGATQMQRIDYVYFDQPTGMLDVYTDVQEYNNPEMTLAVIWQLTSCSLWTV